VTRVEFSPVRVIVYGLVGLILTDVVVSLLAMVVSGEPRARAADHAIPAMVEKAGRVMP
jgi:hypothetical protein